MPITEIDAAQVETMELVGPPFAKVGKALDQAFIYFDLTKDGIVAG